MRFLNIRLDQLPQSVGGLAAQLRGYETLRNFLAGITTQVLVDAPYALFFLGVIYLIAGWLAFIPLAFLCLSVMIGWYFKQQIALLAQQANGASHFKTGLLVETVEGAETIKSGQGGWRMLSRWMNTTDQARGYELEMRTISDSSQHMVVSFQQFSYIALIASGALMVSQGELTIGSLIACSILSGRILTPVASIPHQLLLWAHTKAALTSLDEIWKLQDDHHGQVQPLVLNSIKGDYQFENVTAYYGDSVALTVTKLQIKPGEKIAVLGPVGSGKTTLLRLLSGMYKPQEGRIRLDNVDLAHLSKPVLAEHTGYVHQEGRLFAGTVRENLILGLLDPGDEVLLSVARKTGLLQTVIAAHPLGLQRPISEGGIGLSGGQRQLVNLTRAVLRKPTIWLLDEPTASMDGSLEMRLKTVLNDALKPQHTLVLVTHKTDMLDLVERIIVIAQHKVLMDGPKHEVLKQLQASERLPASVDSNVRGKIV
jgi:ATP-binding cassette subfamily C protein LapB